MERLLLLVSLGVSANAFHVPSTPVLHRQRLVQHAFFDVELSKPMGILFEENAPEYGGLYVLELTEGGAAATSGALEPNDQLVSIAGNGATGPDASFDNVMDALGATESPAKLRFFRGSAAELAAANAPAAPAAAPKSDKTSLTVMQAGAPTEIKVNGEKLLRNVLLENKVELYGGMAKLTNCGGTGQCGTCMVNVEDSADGLANGAFSARTAAEEKKLKKRPGSVRLACQVVCQGGDATVSTKP